MTREQLVRAVGRITSHDDLKAIDAALHRRLRALQERERQAQYQAAWESARTWSVGATVRTTHEIMIFGDQRFSFKPGERLIVRYLMPRARAVCFEVPDRADWLRSKQLYRADARDLQGLGCQLDPPSDSESVAR